MEEIRLVNIKLSGITGEFLSSTFELRSGWYRTNMNNELQFMKVSFILGETIIKFDTEVPENVFVFEPVFLNITNELIFHKKGVLFYKGSHFTIKNEFIV